MVPMDGPQSRSPHDDFTKLIPLQIPKGVKALGPS